MRKRGHFPQPLPTSSVILFLIFTCGIYSIYWIYSKNREFEDYFGIELNPARGVTLLFFLPVIFTSIFILLMQIISFIVLLPFIIILSSFILFAAIKYLFEFSIYGSRISKTPLVLWFLPFSISLSGIIFILLGNYITGIGLIAIELFHIPILQNQMNMTYKMLNLKNQRINSVH